MRREICAQLKMCGGAFSEREPCAVVALQLFNTACQRMDTDEYKYNHSD